MIERIKQVFQDVTVVTVLGMGTGALIASELGNRAMIAASNKDVDNSVFAAFLGMGTLFTATATGFAQAAGIGMLAWGGGKLLWRNIVVPTAKSLPA